MENGTVSSYTLNWTRVPVLSFLTDSFDCPVIINSDGNVGLIAEKYFGAANGKQNVCYIRIGKSIGAGLMINGEIYRGSEGFSGRVGHTIIEINAVSAFVGAVDAGKLTPLNDHFCAVIQKYPGTKQIYQRS